MALNERPIGMTQEEELLYNIYQAVTQIQGGGGGSSDWSSITNKPTTVAGYGITDVYVKSEVDSLLANSSNEYLKVDGSNKMTAGFYLDRNYIFTHDALQPHFFQNFFGADVGQPDAGFYQQCASNSASANAYELVAYGQIAVRHRLGAKYYVISEGGPNGTCIWNMPRNQPAVNTVLKNLGGPLGDTEWSLLKTINGNSIFGSGDITITGGTGTVNSVNGRNPDGSGNVLLDGTHIEVVPGVGVTVTQAIFDLDSTKIDSIVAGTNITINNTDPKNPIISSTGGGGSSTQTLFFSKVGAVNIGDYVKYNGWDAANRAGYVVHTPRTLTGIRIQTSLIQSAASGQAITVQLYKRTIPAAGIGTQNDTVNGTLIGTCTLTAAAGGTFYYASSINGTIVSPNIAAGDMIYTYVSANTITAVTDILVQLYF